MKKQISNIQIPSIKSKLLADIHSFESKRSGKSATACFLSPRGCRILQLGLMMGLYLLIATATLTQGARAGSLELGLSETKIHMFQSERYWTSKIRAIRTGWTGPVTVYYSGLPSGVTGSLGTANPTMVQLTKTQEVAWLTLSTSSMQAPGVFPITITAYGGGYTTTQTIQLIVMAPCYRGTPLLSYMNYFTGSTGTQCEWDVTAQYDLTVDFRKSPTEVRLGAELLSEAVGNNISKCNGGSASFNQVNSVSSEFPYFATTFDRYGTSGRLAEKIYLTNGRSSGTAAFVQIQPVYVRTGGSGGTLVPVLVTLKRISAPRLRCPVDPPGSGSVSLSSNPNHGHQVGQSVSLVASAKPGYVFKGWTGDVTSSSPSIRVVMSADRKVTASFSEIKIPDIHVEQPVGSGLTSSISKRSFGTVKVARLSAAKTFTISNQGRGDLKNIRVSLSGSHPSDYTLASPPAATLAPGAVTAFSVKFSPKAVGTRSAKIRIASNDPDEKVFTIHLSGKAVK